MKRIFALLLIAAVMGGCRKDDKPVPQDPDFNRRIPFVLEDDYSFNYTGAAITYGYLHDTLTQRGPFTIFAPVNTAWGNLGIYNETPMYWYYVTPGYIHTSMLYHLVRGTVQLSQFPVGTDTALVTMQGGHIYLEKYLDNNDTVVTVNGQTVSVKDSYAANGWVQGINGIMNAEEYGTVMDKMRNEPRLTLFVTALQRAGLVKELDGATLYTVLAPVNDAFAASHVPGMDLTSINGILQADSAQLAQLLKGQFLKGRYFQKDLYRAAAAANGSITMENGLSLAVAGYAPGYNTITFNGVGIYKDNSVYNPAQINADIPTGNGNLFKIQAILQ